MTPFPLKRKGSLKVYPALSRIIVPPVTLVIPEVAPNALLCITFTKPALTVVNPV